jgi:hypothetical protein
MAIQTNQPSKIAECWEFWTFWRATCCVSRRGLLRPCSVDGATQASVFSPRADAFSGRRARSWCPRGQRRAPAPSRAASGCGTNSNSRGRILAGGPPMRTGRLGQRAPAEAAAAPRQELPNPYPRRPAGANACKNSGREGKQVGASTSKRDIPINDKLKYL